MAEFTPITTQEEFNAAIGERIKREKEKYSDYDDMKNKISAFENKIAEMTKNAEDAAKKYSGYDDTVAGMQAKIKNYETASVKARIAHESGIPYELAGRLSGETEDDIRKDAECISKLLNTGSGNTFAPGKSSEPADGGANSKAALRAFAQQLTNKE